MTQRSSTTAVALAAAAAWAIGAAAAGADTFDFTIVSNDSTLQNDATIVGDLPGHLVGDYDPIDNPGGTLTRPGLFGGSGNQPVPFQSTTTSSTQFTSHPSGAFTLAFDFAQNTVDLSGLQLDLLNGQQPLAETVLSILFDTFRTFQPDSVFPGGVPVDIPLSDISLTELTATQVQPASGLLSDVGGGRYLFSVALEVEVAMTVVMEGEIVPFDPVIMPLALAGEVLIDGGNASLASTFQLDRQEVFDGPFEGAGLTDEPFDVPTVLPPGHIAHLLVTNQLVSVDLDMSNDVSIVASGVRIAEPADLTDVAVAYGTHLSGGLPEVLASDDIYYRGRSRFGFSAVEANAFELLVGAESELGSPEFIDLTIESKLNNPNGRVRVRLRNWSTGLLEQVHEYVLGTVETVEQVADVNAADRVRAAGGRIELSLRQSVVATFSLAGFDASFDHIRIAVR